ncbi:TolC family protein [candidate division KSB1 bacterium]|nr:TolC family protein [candidate division KSB1 bacterium]
MPKSSHTTMMSGILLVALALIAGGCASTSPRVAFNEVHAELKQRGVDSLYWHSGAEEDRQVGEAMARLLEQNLTAETAVQIALLNNRRLQSVYQTLGIAQADLVQAGLLSNPVFGGEYRFAVTGGLGTLGLSVAQSFLELFYIPLRKRVAKSQLEEAKITVAGLVLDFEYETRLMFYQVQANAQLVEMFQQVGQAMASGYDFARRLHAAGNITDLELNQQRDLYEQARLDLRQVEADLIHSRERLNQLMGLYGEQIHWKAMDRLADVPGKEIDVERLEARVIEQSLDLKLAAQRIITAGHRLGFTKTTALIPWLDIGVDAEKTEAWEVGPALSFPIPLFDQGRPRIARNRAELRQEQERYTAFAVEIRSIARQYQNHLEAAKDMARHYRQVILPLRERITNETQLQYNAMQVGLLDLLRAREQQIEAGKAYVHTLYEYWSAKIAIELLLRGRVPRPIETIEGPVPFGPVSFDGEQ